MIRSKYALTALVILSLSSSACAPALVGAGATAGVAAAREGGVSGAATDVGIRAQINDLWFRKDVDMFRKVSMTVDQGRVLLTGIVQNPEHRVEAVRLAWQPNGVKQVINEIKVANSEGIQGFVRDGWLTSQLRAKITFDKQVQSINYSIDTVQGNIYLMGVAASPAERDRVVEIARSIRGVRGVVSYVKLVGEPIDAVGVPTAKTTGTLQLTPEPQQGDKSIYAVQPVAPVETIQRESLQ